MSKYTIQFNIVGKGVNELDNTFTHNFFKWLDNWGGWYYDEYENGIGVDEKTIDDWEAVEFQTMSNGLFSVFNQGIEELTPIWKITNIDTSIHWDLWEAIVDEIADNSSWYFNNTTSVDITGFNMTVDLIEHTTEDNYYGDFIKRENGFNMVLSERFELGEYIQKKALQGKY